MRYDIYIYIYVIRRLKVKFRAGLFLTVPGVCLFVTVFKQKKKCCQNFPCSV